MKKYSVAEFARVLGVTSVTVNNWIKSKKLLPAYTETGQPYFTSEQVVHTILTTYFKFALGCANLYIVKRDNKEESDEIIKACINAQQKLCKDSIYIEDFESFFTDIVEGIKVDRDQEQLAKVMQGRLAMELAKRLNNYVTEKIVSILEIDRSYKEDFTWSELEAVVTGDKERLTPELIERFDSIAVKVSESPNNNNLNKSGTLKKCHAVKSEYLGMQMKMKVSEISKKLGIADNRILGVSYAKLLSLDTLDDKEILEIFTDEDFKISMKSSYTDKLLKSITLDVEKKVLRDKIRDVMKKGFYYVYKLTDAEESVDMLYQYLDMNAFSCVILAGSTLEQIPSDIRRKIKAGEAASQFSFTEL